MEEQNRKNFVGNELPNSPKIVRWDLKMPITRQDDQVGFWFQRILVVQMMPNETAKSVFFVIFVR